MEATLILYLFLAVRIVLNCQLFSLLALSELFVEFLDAAVRLYFAGVDKEFEEIESGFANRFPHFDHIILVDVPPTVNSEGALDSVAVVEPESFQKNRTCTVLFLGRNLVGTLPKVEIFVF